jgi:enoyl-CoA hydratase/carnithine racemase
MRALVGPFHQRHHFTSQSLHRLLSSSSISSEKLVGWSVNEETKVGTITLQAPETYNALTVEMGQDFAVLCREITHDLTTGQQDVHAIVLQGQGDDAFSAGGNFEWLKSLQHNSVHENADIMLQFYSSFLCVRRLPVPVIAAIQGPAIGAGACLALACDLRTAAPKRKILGFTFSSLGIHSGMGGSHLLQCALGGPSAIINEILLTGKVLSGDEALELGLVNRVAEDAKGAAYELASKIADQHPVAIRTMLQTIRQHQDDGLEQALQREALAQAICYNREDWGEGVDAISEKRDPVFDSYHKK